MHSAMLIIRVDMSAEDAAWRARITEVLRLDRPETERVFHTRARSELHERLDRWLDAVLWYPDDEGGNGPPSAGPPRW